MSQTVIVSPLPIEYQWVGYISSSNRTSEVTNGGIDTGVKRDTSVYAFEIDYKLNELNKDVHVFGSAYPIAANDFIQAWTDGKIYFRFCNNEFTKTSDLSRHKVNQSFNNGVGTFTYDGVVSTHNYTNAYPTHNERVFSITESNGTVNGKG